MVTEQKYRKTLGCVEAMFECRGPGYKMWGGGSAIASLGLICVPNSFSFFAKIENHFL
jgi:hypothetical protein